MKNREAATSALVFVVAAALAACGGGSGSGEDAGQASADGSGQAPVVVAPAPVPSEPGSTACDSATGRQLLVGPGQPYATPSAAAAAAQSGDVVKITAGDYRGDVAAWRADNLTICGVGGRARLYADGRNAAGKGIWVISGRDVTVDSVEFHDAKVPDENGAGIRAEHQGQLLVRNSGFFDNENGILSNGGSASVVIEGCEFARNGFGDGYTHNIYIGELTRLTVTASFFHEARTGHNLKSRASENVIENSYFMDGPDGNSSYLADFPNGGKVLLRGNLFHKGPKAENSTAIAYGAEGLKWSTNTLEMTHNTVVMTRSGGSFLSAPVGTQRVGLKANLFAGTGSPALITGGFPAGSVEQVRHVSSSAAHLPNASNIGQPDFWPDAALLPQLEMAEVIEPGYTKDAPRPMVLRSLSAGARLAGALQSASQ